MAHYSLKKSSDGKFFFNLVADNNETVLTSEMYNAKDGALNGIESVKTNAPLDERYEEKEASNGQPYFVLKAGNHEIICTSEQYSSKQAMKGGMEAVQRIAPTADIEE